MEPLNRFVDYLNGRLPEYGDAVRQLSPKRARALLNESEQTFREEYLPFFWDYLRGTHRKLVGPDATADEFERRNISHGTREARGYMRECGLADFTPVPLPEDTPEEARMILMAGPLNQALLFDGYNVLDDGYGVELVPLSNEGKRIDKERFILPVVIDRSSRVGESRLTDLQWQGDEELIKRMFGDTDFYGNPVTTGVPASFRVGFGKIYAPEEPVVEHPLIMYTSEKTGKDYYLHKGDTYYFSPELEGALDESQFPEGREIFEARNGLPMLRKIREQEPDSSEE